MTNHGLGVGNGSLIDHGNGVTTTSTKRTAFSSLRIRPFGVPVSGSTPATHAS